MMVEVVVAAAETFVAAVAVVAAVVGGMLGSVDVVAADIFVAHQSFSVVDVK